MKVENEVAMRLPNLDAALSKALKKSPDSWGKSVLHISDLGVGIGEGCPRSLWFRLHGERGKVAKTGKLFMFYHGHRLHGELVKLITPHLPKEWVFVKVEQPVELLGLTGRYDYQIIHKSGRKVIVDFKTTRGKSFSYLTKPKPSNVIQVQGYMAAEDADAGILWYIDREGQNATKQFTVQRDDAKVIAACKVLKSIADSEDCPPILPPVIKTTKNKKNCSVRIEMPWQCNYCDYLDISCPGSLKKKHRDLGVIGYWDGNAFSPKIKDGKVVVGAEIIELVEEGLS